MELIKKMQDKKENLGDLIIGKKPSKILKFFVEEIKELRKNNFLMTEQIEIFKSIGIEMNYQTYNSFVKRNIENTKTQIDDTKRKGVFDNLLKGAIK